MLAADRYGFTGIVEYAAPKTGDRMDAFAARMVVSAAGIALTGKKKFF